jgi:regulator of sigma D
LKVDDGMATELEIIDQVIAQHQIVRLNLQGVQNSLTDFDALFNLQKAQSRWAQSSLNLLSDQKRQLQEALSRVQQGLSGHFSWEEQVLPALFGQVLMKALLFVHGEIKQQIEKIMSTVADSSTGEPELKDLIAQKSRFHDATATLVRMVEEHATLEEQILGMMRKAFQS